MDGGSTREVIGVCFLPNLVTGLVSAWQNRGLCHGSVAQGSLRICELIC